MRIPWSFILIVAIVACKQRPADIAGRAGEADVADTTPGMELEAQPLIPAIRAQIAQIREPDGATEGNLTAFRNGTGRLLDAMKADLNRSGVTDTGRFYVFADSVMREFGGGAGNVASISPDEGQQAAAQVERLIEMYEERMRHATR
jgi:hypothetical protein